MSKPLREDCPYHCTNGYVFLESRGTVACPHCQSLETQILRKDVTYEDNVYKELCIPKAYWGITENDCYTYLDEMKETYSRFGDSLIHAEGVMRKLVDCLNEGGLYRDSLYISLGAKELDRYVYSAQILAVMHGVATVPYITLNRLSMLLYSNDVLSLYSTGKDEETNLLEVSSLNGRNTTMATRVRQIMNGIDYIDYTAAPLVFLEITPGTTDVGYLTLYDLLAERARLDLPTYVTGFSGMHKRALTGEFISLGYYEGSGLRKLTPVTLSRLQEEKERSGGNIDILANLRDFKEVDNTSSTMYSDNLKYNKKIGVTL